MSTIPLLIVIAGWLHFSLLCASTSVPIVLRWRKQLRQLDPMTQHVIWTHGAYIMLMITAIGLLSINLPHVLTDGSTLGRSLAGFICLFWLIRLTIQLVIYNPGSLLNSRFRLVGYHALTLLFAYFTGIYGLAALM